MSTKKLIVYNSTAVVSIQSDQWHTDGETMTVHIKNDTDTELEFYLQSGIEIDGIMYWSNIIDPDDSTIDISFTSPTGELLSIPLDGCNKNTYYRIISDGTGATGDLLIIVDL